MKRKTNPRIVPCGSIVLIAGSQRVGGRHDYPQSNRFQATMTVPHGMPKPCPQPWITVCFTARSSNHY